MIPPRKDLTDPRSSAHVARTVEDLLETLRHARAAVGREWDAVRAASSSQNDRLWQLRQSLRSFGTFADRLLVVMSDRGLDGPTMDEAEQLYDFFHGLEAEIVERTPMSGT